ncbi:hypothetical protein PC116_g26502 [Phytophthora cactorum]|uniref:Uncharacterized protein n=1 Tax=Phytophthora cactorum TaxID=29920 RepID=A0A8T1JPZ2_9STRA|nr:hypothetical protein PC111_g22504 [Phytophthora cactorum]KAG2795122.1 hypothetical protein PC112_g22767 [Phytophthora cactorum]KAG2887522.1 hypothetical protein PC115_g20305 [Phytophthora cactorum]KAG2903662.1 hypothetical protein PC114_g12159 [Phytophthora cactorum]KAG2973197.1 hypothetical protein PC118_g15275 [Phytophthora cactorum]
MPTYLWRYISRETKRKRMLIKRRVKNVHDLPAKDASHQDKRCEIFVDAYV